MAESSLPVEHLFTLNAKISGRHVIPNGPQGSRAVVGVNGGTFKGARLEGTVAESPGGDWVTSRADGSARLDVRLLLQTNDGANILMTYSGIGMMKDGAFSIRTAPQFETGDERYAWLNNVQAVGIGARTEGGVAYEIYALK
jgi:hypothetical protein